MDSQVSIATAPLAPAVPEPHFLSGDWRTAGTPVDICAMTATREGTSNSLDWIEVAMRSIRSLGADWDGYGADPIAEQTIRQLAWLLRHDVPDRAEVGSIVPGGDGSLQAEWHLDSVELGLIVEPGGSVFAWVRPRAGPEIERSGLEARELFWSVANIYLA